MDSRIALLARDLRRAHGDRRVLRGIDLAIREGACVVLRGGNGAGKSTLIRCLAGLLRPDAGTVHWFDHAPSEPEARRLIGVACHETQLHPHLTIREHLDISARLHGLADASRRVDRRLGEAGLARVAELRPREVSQGMRRRVAIVRATLHAPPILLLDEPSVGLDREGRAWLEHVLDQRAKRGETTLLATHDESLELPTRHRAILLRHGVLGSEASVLPGFPGDQEPETPWFLLRASGEAS